MKVKITGFLLLLSLCCIKSYSQLTVDSVAYKNSESSCSCTGIATAYVRGGYMPYTYHWSNGETTQRDTDLCPGNYVLVVYDSHHDSARQFLGIGPPPIVINIGSVEAGCADTSGRASAGVRGGEIPYTYLWMPGGKTTATISGLSASTYTITVKDANGCTATNDVVITSGLILTTRATNVGCNGGSNGMADVANVNGGTSPYTYSWTPLGGSNALASGLSAGTYTVTVKDSNGCSGTSSVLVTQPAVLVVDSVSFTGAPCNSNYGTATAYTGGGTRPYAYVWTPSGATTVTATGLSAGTYSVAVTDRNGCTASESVTITITGPAATIMKVNDSCFGESNGSAIVTNVRGGVSPYTYNWTPSGGTNATATGLSAGTYTLTIKDNAGCSGTMQVIINQPPPITLVVDTTTDTGTCNGSASIMVTGGIPPLVYTWSVHKTTTITSPNTANTDSLCAGKYLLCVTDGRGCSVCDSVTIPGLFAGVNELKSSDFSFLLYPDPVKSQLTIQYSGLNSQNCKLEVFDMLGRQVLQQNNVFITPGQSTLLDVSALIPGEYMLRISNTGFSHLQPFVVTH